MNISSFAAVALFTLCQLIAFNGNFPFIIDMMHSLMSKFPCPIIFLSS